MRRFFATIVIAGLLAMPVLSHGDDSHFANKQDVTVKVTKVTANVHLLQGRGGNIAALTGPEGILIVDDDYRTVSEKLREALKGLGSPAPRYILNTHWHGDHTEGNEAFGKESTIIAHANVRKRMSQENFLTLFNMKVPASPVHAWPVITYEKSMSLYINGEEVQLIHYPGGHTDGDTVVWFKNANVVHLGDDFFVGRFPFVDLDSGGSVNGLIHHIAAIIQTVKPDTKIIPGHGPLATVDDLKTYYQLIVESSQIVTDAMKAGKTLDEIKKAGLPEKFKAAGSGFIKTDVWIDIVYRSYSKK